MTVRQLSDARVGTAKSELVAQRSFSHRVVRRLAGSWRVAPRHSTCWTRVPWAKLCDRTRRRLLAHRWLYAVADRRYQRLYAPKPAGPSWLVSAFLCIHRFEGSWTDSGDPYWGGLQFGPGEWTRFGGQYAPTADEASPSQQIAAAIAYWRVSGFNPWPSTARACGLL